MIEKNLTNTGMETRKRSSRGLPALLLRLALLAPISGCSWLWPGCDDVKAEKPGRVVQEPLPTPIWDPPYPEPAPVPTTPMPLYYPTDSRT